MLHETNVKEPRRPRWTFKIQQIKRWTCKCNKNFPLI